MTHRWLEETGGNLRDWKLEPAESLDPATSVDYVRTLFERVPEPPAITKKKKIKKNAQKAPK